LKLILLFTQGHKGIIGETHEHGDVFLGKIHSSLRIS